MAIQTHILVPGAASPSKTNVTGPASSAEIVLGNRCIFLIVCDAALNLKFGVAGMSAAAATDMLIPANFPMTFDTSDLWSSVRVFGTGNAYILKLSKS